MRATSAWAAGLAVLFAAAVATAWLLPPRLAQAQLRPLVERLAAERLGADVAIGGDVRLALLPRPVLLATGVSVRGRAGTTLRVAELRLDLSAAPLLAGRIEALSLRLRGAALRLPVPFDPHTLLGRMPDWTVGGAILVEDASITIGDSSLDGITATLLVDPLTRGVRVDGRIRIGGIDCSLVGHATAPGGDGAVGLDLAIAAPRILAARLSGQAAADGGFTGQLTADGADLSRLLPAPATAWRAAGRLTAGGGLVAADDLTLELGRQAARGVLTWRWAPQPRLDIALATGQLDLDAWLDARRLPSTSAEPHPLWPVSLDISAEAATLRRGILRDVRVAIDWTQMGFDLHEAQASLPGAASAHLSGGGRVQDIAGEMRFNAPDVPATASWLAAAGWLPGAVQLALLPRAAAGTAHLRLTPQRATIALADATEDGHPITGSLAIRLPVTVASADLTIDADRVDLDGVLPDNAAWPAWLGALSLKARRAQWRHLTVQPLSVDAVADDTGRIVWRRLDAWLGAVHVSASGTRTADARLDDVVLDAASPTLAELRPLLPASWPNLPRGSPMAHAQLALHLAGSGPLDGVSTRVAASWGDLSMEATPVIDLLGHGLRGQLLLRHPSARRLLDEAGLLHATGLDGDAAWLGEGSLALAGNVALTPDLASVDDADLTLGGLRADGALRFDRGDARLTGRIAAQALPLPGPDAVATTLLPLSLLSGWQAAVRLEAATLTIDRMHWADAASADATLGGGVLRLDHVAARIAGGDASGSVLLDTAAAPPALRGRFALRNAAIVGPLLGWPVDLVAGSLSLDGHAEATGYSGALLRATARGAVAVDVRGGTLGGIDLPGLGDLSADAAVRTALSAGVTPAVSGHLDLTRSGLAAASLAGTFTTPTADLAVAGTLDSADALADVLLTITPKLASSPQIGLRLAGRLYAPAATLELAGIARWRAAAH